MYSSSFIMAIGFIVSLFAFWKMTRTQLVNEENVFDFVLFFIFGVFFFGRLIYAFANANDFQLKFDRIIHLYRYPGLNLWGALIGGTIASLVFLYRGKINVYSIFDKLAVALSLFLAFSFIGFFFDGTYVGQYSKILGLPFFGWPGKRLPIQLFGALVFLILHFSLKKINHSKIQGLSFWLFLNSFFLIFLVLEFLRHDRIYFEGVILNKLLFFSFFLFCSAVILIKYKNNLKNLFKRI